MRKIGVSCVVGLFMISAIPVILLIGSQNASAGYYGLESGYELVRHGDYLYSVGDTTDYITGLDDIILSKYSADTGQLVWSKRYGEPDVDDNGGAIYVTDSYMYVVNDMITQSGEYFKIYKVSLDGQSAGSFYYDTSPAFSYVIGIVVNDNTIYITGGIQDQWSWNVLCRAYSDDGNFGVVWSQTYDLADFVSNPTRNPSCDKGAEMILTDDYIYFTGSTDCMSPPNTYNWDMFILKLVRSNGSIADNTWPIIWDGGYSWTTGRSIELNPGNTDYFIVQGENQVLVNGNFIYQSYCTNWSIDGSLVWISIFQVTISGNPVWTQGNSIVMDSSYIYRICLAPSGK